MEFSLAVTQDNRRRGGSYVVDAKVSLENGEDRCRIEGFQLEAFRGEKAPQFAAVGDVLLCALEEGPSRLESVAYLLFPVQDVKEIPGVKRRILVQRGVNEGDGDDVSLNEVGDEVFDVGFEVSAGSAEIVGIELHFDLSLAEGKEEHVCGPGTDGGPGPRNGADAQEREKEGDGD